MSSNGSATRLPPIASRTPQPLDSSATSGQQPPARNVPASQPTAPDRRSSVQSRFGSPVPRSPVTAEGGPGSRPSRALGVHSILNPAGSDESEKHGRRRSAAKMESEGGSVGATSPRIADISRPSSSRSDAPGFGPVSPTDPGARPGLPRRILTPISPTIHRATSLNRLATGPISTGTAPTGTIDAHQSPFLGDAPGARIHVTQPTPTGLPSLNSISDPAQRYSMPQATTPPMNPHPMPRCQSASSVMHSNSTRASPAPTFQSYSRSGQASPALPHHPSSSVGTSSFGGSPALGPVTNLPPVDAEQFGVPLASTGQSSYQLLTIETGKGPMQYPVEVQAASRMADEKRKRNAGASARFRARRKEKEREAATRIQTLEQQVREALEELEWYRKDRDELLGILRNVPGGDRYLTREKSPKARREEEARRAGGVIEQRPLPQDTPYSFERPQEPERNVRRRTESYSLPPESESAPPPSYYAHGQYQHEAQPSRQLTPLQPYAAASGGPLAPIHARPTEPYEQHPRPLDPAWPPRPGPPR